MEVQHAFPTPDVHTGIQSERQIVLTFAHLGRLGQGCNPLHEEFVTVAQFDSSSVTSCRCDSCGNGMKFLHGRPSGIAYLYQDDETL